MQIIKLTYKIPLDRLNTFLAAHLDYLDHHYALGNFLASGPENPKTGGIILANISDRKQLLEIVEQDPFVENDAVDYELIEFSPTKTCNEFTFLKETSA